MQYINRTTGEIIDITPYRLQLLREVLRANRRSDEPEYLIPGRTCRARHHNRTSWCYWTSQFVSHFGPVLISLYVLWILAH
jgi:hypothetical protein